MDALDYGGYSLVEVVEVGDELDEAEVDEGILAPHDAAVDLLLPSSATELIG